MPGHPQRQLCRAPWHPPHHHRSGRGRLKIELPEGIRPIPELFREAGYYTSITGWPNKPRTNVGKTDYNFEWDRSMYDGPDWSDRQEGQPFFAQIQLPGGKHRGGSRESARRFAARIEEMFGSKTSPESVTLPPSYPRDPVLLEDWAAYLDTVRLTDRFVGQIVRRLEDEGDADNTVVLFMTDHGISHARGKQFLYEEGAHVPLIIRGPGVPAGLVRPDLVEHIDLAALSLAAAGLGVPSWMQGKDILAPNYAQRDEAFSARDRCDETTEKLRSLRTDKFIYIRNYHPQRPHLQPCAYKDGKQIVQQLRALHAAGKLSELSEKLLFSPTRPREELYELSADRWQVRNLADDPAYAAVLAEHRQRLDAKLVATRDPAPESMAMYDSDMKPYLGKGNPEVERNIAQMKRWAAEGK